jgi:hypothetical protein
MRKVSRANQVHEFLVRVNESKLVNQVRFQVRFAPGSGGASRAPPAWALVVVVV